MLNLESGGAPYYEVIEGANAYLSGGNPEADISGIETNDKTGEITIELTAPEAAFSNVLAMNFAGLVAGRHAIREHDQGPGSRRRALTCSPSRCRTANSCSRRTRGSREGQIPGVPEANIETMTTKIVPSVHQQTQDVIDNKLDFMQEPPAADLKAEILERFGPDGSEEQRYKEFPTLSTYYFFLNTRVPPFDDQKVREAVNVGVDKPAPGAALRRRAWRPAAPSCRRACPATARRPTSTGVRGATRTSRRTSSAPSR